MSENTTEKKDNTAEDKYRDLTPEQLKDVIAKQEETMTIMRSVAKERKTTEIRGENCKNETNYHIGMSVFKEYIFKNKKRYEKFIVSETPPDPAKKKIGEVVLSDSFRTVFINELINKAETYDNTVKEQQKAKNKNGK